MTVIKKLAILALAVGVSLTQVATAGVVSVSNYPLALLSNAVTKGNHDAKILLEAGDVGHHGSLSPSKVKLIEESDFVVWFGQDLEQNLVKTLADAPNDIALLDFDAFSRLPLRNLDGTAKADSQDVHLWLDPQNAKAIVRALAVIHGHANPEYREQYANNAQEFAKRLDEVVATFDQQQSLPYWAYHDSFQYIEQAIGLKFAGALTPDHHLAPKASQFRLLNEHRPAKQMCLASQNDVSDGIKNKLGNVKTSIHQEDMSDGEEDFVAAWQALANSLVACAKP